MREIIRPQPGPQTEALSSKADICIQGGAAGGGKTMGLLLEPLRHIHNGLVRVAFFMRESTLITKPNSLWDKSITLYPLFGGMSRSSGAYLDWRFPSRMSIKFAGMEQESDAMKWKNTELALINFDQLEMFTEFQFFYLMSRLRSVSGVRGYIRGSCNPDPDCFLAKLLEWWIDQNSGYAIPSRSGVLRWFVRFDDNLIWGDTREELIQKIKDTVKMDTRAILPISLTFIPSTIYDNPILLKGDPQYLAYLESLPDVERERLLKGNWKIRPAAGLIFSRTNFKLIPRGEMPSDIESRVRSWDKASTEGGKKDRTAGVKISRSGHKFFIEDCVAVRLAPAEREILIRQKAVTDGRYCDILLEQEPGSSGKTDIMDSIRRLAGYTVESVRPTGKKVSNWRPLATQVKAGNIYVVQDEHWNDEFLTEMHNADGIDGHLDDIPDAGANGFNYLTGTLEELLLGSVQQ